MSIEITREEPNLNIKAMDVTSGKLVEGRVIDLPDKLEIKGQLDTAVCDNPSCNKMLPMEFATKLYFEDINKTVYACPDCAHKIMESRIAEMYCKLVEVTEQMMLYKEEVEKLKKIKPKMSGKLILPSGRN